MPRRKSVHEKIKTMSKSLPPKRVVSQILSEAGGAENLGSISSTPRDVQQARNLKRNIKDKHQSRSGSCKSTNFNAILRLSMQGEFVRSFELSKGGHPKAFCATDQQLRDLERHCTRQDPVVLQIDPTFSVGNFYLTCTTFRSKQFYNKTNGKSVLMAGPYMIHATKCEADYEFFARHISEAIKHKKVLACGSDGEKALQNGFRKAESFKDSMWLLCMIHAKENCKRKLDELGVNGKAQNEILKQIYGSEVETHEGRIRTLGLVDVEDNEKFDEKLKEKAPIWDSLERASSSKEPLFSQWFIKNKADETKASVLLPVRRAAGLGSQKFTTNDVESENTNVKRSTDWHKKSWDEAANILHSKVLAHYEELNRAIYKDGEYRLKTNYKELEKEPYEWAKMSIEDRRKSLQKAKLKPLPSETSLTISAEESGIAGYSISNLKDTWQTAQKLILKENAIIEHPGDQNAFVVFDSENIQTVRKINENGFFSCEKCEDYRLHDNLFCPHTIAVAESNKSLLELITSINSQIEQKSKGILNAAVSASCRGSGQKPTKRKGLNNRLASDIVATRQPFSEISEEGSVPSTSSVLLATGPGSTCAAERAELAPLTHFQIETQKSQPFTITFRQGLIRRCVGCNTEFSQKTKKPPFDIILKKKDFREYPKDGIWHRSNSLTNTFYHLNLDCVRSRFPHTQLKDIILYDEVQQSLTCAHINVLHTFGLHDACSHE